MKKKKILAENIIIATGAEPKKIKISKNYDELNLWNYIDAMTPSQIPKSLGIIGSGAIGIEFASFYNSLGTNVEVFEMQTVSKTILISIKENFFFVPYRLFVNDSLF